MILPTQISIRYPVINHSALPNLMNFHYQSGASSQTNPTPGHTLWIAMCMYGCYGMILHFRDIRPTWSWAIAHQVPVAHWSFSPTSNLYFWITLQVTGIDLLTLHSGKKSVVAGDSDDEDAPNTYDYNDSFLNDEQVSGSSSSGNDKASDDSDWGPEVEDSQDIRDLKKEAKGFIKNKKMQQKT